MFIIVFIILRQQILQSPSVNTPTGYVAGSILSTSSFFGPSSRFLPCCMVYTDGPILRIFPLPKHSSPL